MHGTIVYILDGLFALLCKKSAGVSHRSAVHGSLFFCNQEAIDEFVAEASVGKQVAQVLALFLPSCHVMSIVPSYCFTCLTYNVIDR